jgi:hypothetical protein
MDTSEFALANERLEKNDFAAAVREFRLASLVQLPIREDLFNLGVSEDEERLAFRRKLVQLYPDAFHCHVDLLMLLQSIGRPAMALKLATELLEIWSGSSSNMLTIRLIRLKIAIKSKNYDTFLRDFIDLWSSGKADTTACRIKKAILGAIAGSADPDFSTLLDKLANSPILESTAADFIIGKASELRLLRKVQDLILRTDGSENISTANPEVTAYRNDADCE